MPTKSTFPDVEIPNVDLWGLMFESKRQEGFSDDQVIYRTHDNSRHYTWRTVKETATQFGEGLRSQWDWQKGDVIAIVAPNNIDVGPIIYGAFFAGAIVSPANPGYGVDELAFQLENSGAKAVATHAPLLDTVQKAADKAGVPRNRIILLGDQKDKEHKVKHFSSIRKLSGTERYKRRKMDPDNDLAFLVYSSGTTGLPKGVMLSHTNIVADVLMIKGSVGKWYSWDKDKFLGVLPFFHIYGLTGLVHQPLHRGIELVVMPGFDLEVFCKTIQQHTITFVYVAPPVLVRLAKDKTVDKYDLSSLKMITSGAAPLTQELVDELHNRLKVKVNQAYGLSETSPMTHTQPWDEWYSSVGSVGKMFPNLQAAYMHEDGKTEAKPGEPGELWLKGPNVFKGYWKNEEATRNSLTDSGYFKTGDVGYQDEQGNFYITDRVKELIKYKGFQVAPAELEGQLMASPHVNDVAVIGITLKAEHTEVPRAYIVPADSSLAGAAKDDAKAQEKEKEIVEWLAGRVANHKRLRGGVRFIEEVPKSAAGKILRRMLKDKALEEEKAEEGRAKL